VFATPPSGGFGVTPTRYIGDPEPLHSPNRRQIRQTQRVRACVRREWRLGDRSRRDRRRRRRWPSGRTIPMGAIPENLSPMTSERRWASEGHRVDGPTARSGLDPSCRSASATKSTIRWSLRNFTDSTPDPPSARRSTGGDGAGDAHRADDSPPDLRLPTTDGVRSGRRETAGSACSRARRCRPVGSDVDTDLDRPNARDLVSHCPPREGVQIWTGPTREASTVRPPLVDSSSRRRTAVYAVDRQAHGRGSRPDVETRIQRIRRLVHCLPQESCGWRIVLSVPTRSLCYDRNPHPQRGAFKGRRPPLLGVGVIRRRRRP